MIAQEKRKTRRFVRLGTDAAKQLTVAGNIAASAELNQEERMITSQKNILLVDADAVVCEDLARAFTSANYQVVTAANGQEAFEKIAATTIDATLLDLDRPDQHRWQTIRYLTTKNPAMPAIGLTARSDRHSLANAAGLEALLEKPLDLSRLLTTVAQLLTEAASASVQPVLRQDALSERTKYHDVAS